VKKLVIILVGALCGLMSMVAVAPANAAQGTSPKTPNPGSPITSSFVQQVGIGFLNNQNDLEAYIGWIISQPGIDTSGYIASVDFPANKAATLLWYGPSSPLQQQILNEGTRRGIAVTVQYRQHSLAQIDAATAAIWQSAAQGQWQGFGITDIAGISADFDGIVVNGDYTATPAAQRAPQVRSLVTTALGVPVRVAPGTAATVAAGSRDKDFAPFNAGGYMVSPSNGSTCSSGFAIRISGRTHTTTARHCNRNDYRDRDASNTYGTAVVNSRDGGGRELSATGSALAFDGPWNSVNFTKTVAGFRDLGVNDLVCTGGGNSGEHCNIKVDNLRVSFNDGFGAFFTIHGTQQSSGTIAAIQGDSGGPVITLAGAGRVSAAGMIQAVNLVVANCGPVRDPGNTCGRGVLFSSMRTVVNNISGASLVTG